MENLLNYIPLNSIKPVSFFLIFITCFILEQMIPIFHTKRKFKDKYRKRFFINISLLLSSIITIQFLFPKEFFSIIETPYLPFSIAQLSFLPGLLITIILFDMAIYWQHRLFHIIPFFWKLHSIHHSDKEMDLSSGFRFHPGEIYFSALYKIGLLFLLTPRLEQFIIYETMLFSMAIFNHSNIKVSKKLDNFLRYFIVTPSMHAPHHHPDKENTNSNYGNTLSIWDRLFGSYNGIRTNIFGLTYIVKEQSESFKFLLVDFLKPKK